MTYRMVYETTVAKGTAPGMSRQPKVHLLTDQELALLSGGDGRTPTTQTDSTFTSSKASQRLADMEDAFLRS